MNQIAKLWGRHQLTLPGYLNISLKTQIRQAFIAGAEAMRADLNRPVLPGSGPEGATGMEYGAIYLVGDPEVGDGDEKGG